MRVLLKKKGPNTHDHREFIFHKTSNAALPSRPTPHLEGLRKESRPSSTAQPERCLQPSPCRRNITRRAQRPQRKGGIEKNERRVLVHFMVSYDRSPSFLFPWRPSRTLR